MKNALDFQSIIMKLQTYWAKQGCLIWQPYYSQVGAGTYNPATFLRALGPEPWRVAYVEPSIRPDDGRYGENPNRMQMHYQFQVILKPDPGNPQELYLRSLEAIGINPLQHDIRFVEDNWESPALGAWGLGWEVWLDGQEITQFTYFQQAGGIQLDPVSVELTYGLERIAMALQVVDSFTEIQWSPSLTDGDVNLQAEQEHSKYYFEVADVKAMRQMYDLFEAEANACLAQGLVLPAYDYVLKCSHTFNVLDTRGAVGVTERQAFFGRMRDLSRRVSEAYLEQRQTLEYPWLEEGEPEVAKKKPVISAAKPNEFKPVDKPCDSFLLEIGTEELPNLDLAAALSQLEENVPVMLEQLRLEHGEIRILGTPRRLVVHVESLATRQTDLETVAKGPPADRSFEEDGTPTQAATGFARSKGLKVEDLEVRELDGGRYLTAVVKQTGAPTVQVLAGALPGLVASLRFDKPMRWNRSNVFFSRPIRWLLAMYGEQVLSFRYADVQAGNTTRGLRFREPADYPLRSIQDYFDYLASQGIELDPRERQAAIQSQVQEIAARVKGQVLGDPGLLSEVANLVEAPNGLLGSFDASHLELPREVLISVMKKHQRYFPVEESGLHEGHPSSHGLLPYFIAVRNGDDQHLDIVTAGNEHVIRARFADAAYFVREDLKLPLEAYLEKLTTLTFQVDLGSMLDKTERISSLTDTLSTKLGLDPVEQRSAGRVARLCKADLATQMVVEMTSLQGVMGYYYALASNEPAEVAVGIREHYLPRFNGDYLPGTSPGLVVSLADRLDTLVGLFAAGLAPTGNRDPFAQRRAALGLVQILVGRQVDFDLRQATANAARLLPVSASPATQDQVLAFIIERLRNLLLEQGQRYDIVDAVLSAQGYNPSRAVRSVSELAGWVSRGDWDSILPAYSRCVRITRDLAERYPVAPELFQETAEVDLYAALVQAESIPRQAGSVDEFLSAFLPMIPAINLFFDRVLVMTEEECVRQNRLGLLQRIAALAEDTVDMTKLEGF